MLLAQHWRLVELRNCFESVSVELVAIPKLIAESRWMHALLPHNLHRLNVAYFGAHEPTSMYLG